MNKVIKLVKSSNIKLDSDREIDFGAFFDRLGPTENYANFKRVIPELSTLHRK